MIRIRNLIRKPWVFLAVLNMNALIYWGSRDKVSESGFYCNLPSKPCIAFNWNGRPSAWPSWTASRCSEKSMLMRLDSWGVLNEGECWG